MDGRNVNTVPITLGPQWSGSAGVSGDPTLIPNGYCVRVRNHVLRPNRLELRPPFVYDGVMNPRGLAAFDDQTNKVSRLMAVDSTAKLYEKATSGDAWSASLATLSGTRLTDATNYRGKLFGMMDDGAGNPTAAFSFDGTNISTAPFNSAIQSRTVTAYLDRLFFAYPRVTVTPLNAIANCYGTGWTTNQVNLVSFTTSGKTTLTAFPQTTANISCNVQTATISEAASALDLTRRVRFDVRYNDATYTLPVSCQTILTVPGALGNLATLRSTGVTAGQLATHPLQTVWRCTTSGTTAVGAPAGYSPSPTAGTQITDGTAVFTLLSNQIQAWDAGTIPTLTQASGEFTAFYSRVVIPWRTNTVAYGVYLNLYNTAQPALSNLSSVDLAYQDGKADGDPGKANRGFQITAGDFYFPFVNTETATSSTQDMKAIVWSDILLPQSVRASATYAVQETVGYPTAAAKVANRYCVSTRSAWWVFTGNTDTNSLDVIPIRDERIMRDIGCIGPKACDTLDDVLYFIGENGVFSWNLGDDPVELGGDAMREEIMNRGSNWVESQSTYNMPLLRIDKKNRELWVYTQKGTIYVYNLGRKGWTTIDVASNAEIADFFFNRTTQKMYVAIGGFGLVRADWAVAPAQDTIDNTGTLYPVAWQITTRPIEGWPRVDAVIEDVGVYHLATASQTSQTFTAQVSFDRGLTFPYSDTVTLDTTIPRNEIPLYESAPSITVSLVGSGKGGPTECAISKLDAKIRLIGAEWPQVRPAPVSASL